MILSVLRLQIEQHNGEKSVFVVLKPISNNRMKLFTSAFRFNAMWNSKLFDLLRGFSTRSGRDMIRQVLRWCSKFATFSIRQCQCERWYWKCFNWIFRLVWGFKRKKSFIFIGTVDTIGLSLTCLLRTPLTQKEWRQYFLALFQWWNHVKQTQSR